MSADELFFLLPHDQRSADRVFVFNICVCNCSGEFYAFFVRPGREVFFMLLCSMACWRLARLVEVVLWLKSVMNCFRIILEHFGKKKLTASNGIKFFYRIRTFSLIETQNFLNLLISQSLNLSSSRTKQLRVLHMQDQIRLRLATGAARSAFARRENLRRVIERQPSTAESNQVIDVIVVVE